MKLIGRLIGFLVTSSTVVGATAVLLMMFQIVIDVVLRNLFSISVMGTTTFVTSYYMLIVAYLPLALAERMNSHIAVEVVAQLLKRRWREWMVAATWAASAVVAGLMAYALWGEAAKAYSHGSFTFERSMPIPIWPGYFVLPVGFGLYALVLVYRLACTVTGTQEVAGFGPEADPDEPATVGER